MKFSVNQQDLQEALNYCQGVIEKRSTLPILSNILLEANNDNLILPTALARKKFSDYRKYLFTSFKRLNKIFNDSHLEYLNPNDPGL